jgi:hypothetical protein
MSGPTQTMLRLFRGTDGTTACACRPVRGNARPFDGRLGGKRYGRVIINRQKVPGTAVASEAAGVSNVLVLGAELPHDSTADMGVDANGRILPGWNPNAGSLALPSQTGGYHERIKIAGTTQVGGGALAATCGPVTVLDGGSGYVTGDTVAITGGGGDATGTLIVRDGRVVGVTLTAPGTVFTAAAPPVLTITSATGSGAVLTAGISQQLIVQTHIPHATHAPLVSGGSIWVVIRNGRVMQCVTSSVPFAAIDDGALDPDQHIMGVVTNNSFAEATGTHADGTTVIGVLTFAAGCGMTNGDIIDVYRLPVRELIAAGAHYQDSTQIRCLDLMWAVVGAAAATMISEINVIPIVGE